MAYYIIRIPHSEDSWNYYFAATKKEMNAIIDKQGKTWRGEPIRPIKVYKLPAAFKIHTGFRVKQVREKRAAFLFHTGSPATFTKWFEETLKLNGVVEKILK